MGGYGINIPGISVSMSAWGKSGKHLLSLSQFDPKATVAGGIAQN
jgi:hypothetical protein